MAEDSLILKHLQAIRPDMADTRGDIREIKNRLATLENGQATIIQHIGHLSAADAEQHVR